jgi:hypothetical protein
MVTVHSCKLYDRASGEWVVQILKRTEQCINDLGGRIIADTAEQVDPSMIDAEGRYIPISE